MNPYFNHMEGSNRRIESFTGAHDFQVNGDMRFTQAQNAYVSNHSYHYSAYPGPAANVDLLTLLNPIHDALHTRDRKVAPPESQCLAGTRQKVFHQLHSWVDSGIIDEDGDDKDIDDEGIDDEGIDEDSDNEYTDDYDVIADRVAVAKSICWMHGPVGCGKSAIAQSIAEQYENAARLAASFFFFRGAGRRSTSDGFATTVAHQIALNVPGARQFIESAVRTDPGLLHSSTSTERQLLRLVYQPLSRCLEAFPPQYPYLIVIDGADECEHKAMISSFIDGIIAFFSGHPHIPLRILITSRVEEHIQTHVEDGAAVVHLFDLSSRSNSGDVERAMKASFEHAKKYDLALRAYGPLWPAQSDVNTLVQHCEGSFIFASTIVRFILRGSGDGDPRTPMDRLALALDINPGIDAVYAELLSRAQHLPHFTTIIPTLVYLRKPLSISAIAALLGLSSYEVIRVLVTLQAIIQVPGRDDGPVTFFHTSLRDFLKTENRAGEFYCPPSNDSNMLERCLDVLFGTEPTSNVECCRYALDYASGHSTGASRLYDGFENWANRPYKPIDRGKWTNRNCTSRRGGRRPIKFEVPVYLLRPLGPLKPPRWSHQYREGTLVVASSSTCSTSDLVDEIQFLYGPAIPDSTNVEVTMKRGEGVYVVVKRRLAVGSGRERSWDFTIEDRIDPEVDDFGDNPPT